MKRFTQISVSGRLIAGFSMMIIIMGIIGFLGYFSTDRIQNNLEEIFTVRLPGIDYLVETDRDLQQLLVAERSMIFAEVSSDEFKKFIEEYETKFKQSQERWEKFKTLATSGEEKALLNKYESDRKEWEVLSRRVVDARKADTREGRSEALDLTLGQAKKKFEEMRASLNALTETNLKNAQKAHKSASSTYQQTVLILIGTIAAGLVIGILLMLAIRRAIMGPLNSVIHGLTEGAELVASASSQVASASQALAQGSSQQAAGLEETSSSIEEMASMTRQNADNAHQANILMMETSRVVEEANGSMGQLTGSMREISAASEETANIIKTIDEIAFQTNLLALNAAVEAARAGEAGAGFAVVSDEVRNLALRAAEAAKNTASLIEGTVKKVKDGGDIVAKTNEAFSKVTSGTQKIGGLVSEISAASNDQAQGIEQINKAVSEMDKVVQKNAASAEESASASEEINGQANKMKKFVADLVTLAGSNGYGNGSKGYLVSRGGSSDKKSGGRSLPTAPLSSRPNKISGGMKKSIPQAREIKPDQIIPMDDESFKEF